MSNDEIFDDLMDVVGGGNDSVTYVCFVRDHSGSMKVGDKHLLALNNFNEQIETLKKETDNMETLVTVIEFDDKVNSTLENVDVHKVPVLGDWWTGGMTALHDAISQGINVVRKQMAQDKRENKAALMIIQTDGDENYSKEFAGHRGQQMLKEIISGLEKSGEWTFVFLGENLDKAIANNIGINDNFMAHDSTQDGYKNVALASTVGIESYYSARKLGTKSWKNFFGSNEFAQKRYEAKKKKIDQLAKDALMKLGEEED